MKWLAEGHAAGQKHGLLSAASSPLDLLLCPKLALQAGQKQKTKSNSQNSPSESKSVALAIYREMREGSTQSEGHQEVNMCTAASAN